MIDHCKAPIIIDYHTPYSCWWLSLVMVILDPCYPSLRIQLFNSAMSPSQCSLFTRIERRWSRWVDVWTADVWTAALLDHRRSFAEYNHLGGLNQPGPDMRRLLRLAYITFGHLHLDYFDIANEVNHLLWDGNMFSTWHLRRPRYPEKLSSWILSSTLTFDQAFWGN